MSTDLTHKSDEFRHGYLTCVDDMREWFLSEQDKQNKERARLHKRFGYRAGAAAVLSLTLKQIAELKRELKLHGEITSEMNKVIRAAQETR